MRGFSEVRGDLRAGAKNQSRSPSRVGGLKKARPEAFAPFDANLLVFLRNPVRHRGTVMGLEGVEGPVGVGDHAKTALTPKENRQVRGRVATPDRAFGGFQQASCILQESTHKTLFGNLAPNFKKFVNRLEDLFY